MPLRRSPVTPASLRARRLNSLKSTGPRTARGKAWSCLNALRHGYRCEQRTLRDKIARTGDPEALYLYDFIFEEIMKTSLCPNEWGWCRLRGLAVRAWCIESGRRGRRVAKTCLRTKLGSGVRIARYAEKFVVPRRLRIGDKAGWGFMLINPVPSRRRRVARGWIPEVQYTEGKLPKARRVRGTCQPGTQIVLSGAGRASGGQRESRDEAESRGSRWGTIFKAVGRLGSTILQRLGGSSSDGLCSRGSKHHPLFPSSERRGDPVPEPPSWDQEGLGVVDCSSLPGSGPSRRPPPEDFLEDPEDYESESPEEFLLRHKFLAKLALRAAERASRKRSG